MSLITEPLLDSHHYCFFYYYYLFNVTVEQSDTVAALAGCLHVHNTVYVVKRWRVDTRGADSDQSSRHIPMHDDNHSLRTYEAGNDLHNHEYSQASGFPATKEDVQLNSLH